MWSIMVALPTIQADFGVSRADASLPFTMVMFGFAGGGVLMGRLADRFGIAVPLALGTLAVSAGYLATGWSSSLWQVASAHLLIGAGAALRCHSPRSATMSPARCGRLCCSISSPNPTGARRISASACSAW